MVAETVPENLATTLAKNKVLANLHRDSCGRAPAAIQYVALVPKSKPK